MVILQMKDRAGFDYFLRKLINLHLNYKIEEISDEYYEIAKNNIFIEKISDQYDNINNNNFIGSIQNLIINMNININKNNNHKSLIFTKKESFQIIKIWK